MKQIAKILITTLFLCAPLILFAEEKPGVLMGSYPYDTETASAEIEEVLKNGYVPVGLEVTPGDEIAILYNYDESMDVKRYLLYQFEDASAFEKEFTDYIKKGLLPMDVSFAGDSVFALFIPSPYSIEGWRLTSSALDDKEISDTLAEFKGKGFSPWGISGMKNKLWFLLVDFEEFSHEEQFVNFYTASDEKLSSKIKADMDKGWTPWGLMKRGEAMSILYVQ